MVRTNATLALDQRKDNLFARAAAHAVTLIPVLVLFLAANVGLVNFDRFAFAAKRPGRMKFAHTFAYAVRHKPRRLVGQTEHPVKLMRADTLLAGAHKMRRQNAILVMGICDRS